MPVTLPTSPTPVGALVAAANRVEALENLAAQVLDQTETLLMRLQGHVSLGDASPASGLIVRSAGAEKGAPRSPDILSRISISEQTIAVRLSLASERLVTAINLSSS